MTIPILSGLSHGLCSRALFSLPLSTLPKAVDEYEQFLNRQVEEQPSVFDKPSSNPPPSTTEKNTSSAASDALWGIGQVFVGAVGGQLLKNGWTETIEKMDSDPVKGNPLVKGILQSTQKQTTSSVIPFASSIMATCTSATKCFSSAKKLTEGVLFEITSKEVQKSATLELRKSMIPLEENFQQITQQFVEIMKKELKELTIETELDIRESLVSESTWETVTEVPYALSAKAASGDETAIASFIEELEKRDLSQDEITSSLDYIKGLIKRNREDAIMHPLFQKTILSIHNGTFIESFQGNSDATETITEELKSKNLERYIPTFLNLLKNENVQDLLVQRETIRPEWTRIKEKLISLSSNKSSHLSNSLEFAINGSFFSLQAASTLGWGASLLGTITSLGWYPDIDYTLPTKVSDNSYISGLLRCGSQVLESLGSCVPHLYFASVGYNKSREAVKGTLNYNELLSEIPSYMATAAAWDLLPEAGTTALGGVCRAALISVGMDGYVAGLSEAQVGRAALLLPSVAMGIGSLTSYGYHARREAIATTPQDRSYHLKGKARSWSGVNQLIKTGTTNLTLYALQHMATTAASGMTMGADLAQYGLQATLSSRIQKIDNLENFLSDSTVERMNNERIISEKSELPEDILRNHTRTIEKMKLCAKSGFYTSKDGSVASLQEVKKDYRLTSKDIHPDKFDDNQFFVPFGNDYKACSNAYSGKGLPISEEIVYSN